MAQSKSAGSGPQSIDQLQQRYQKLHEKKIAAETELKGADKRLQELQAEAREKYQTDDMAELAKLLEKLKAENEAKRSAYQTQLDQIEADLAAVEQKFQSVQHPPAANPGA